MNFLSTAQKAIKKLLVKLFNVILKTGIIPSEWCTTFIILIYKIKREKVIQTTIEHIYRVSQK